MDNTIDRPHANGLTRRRFIGTAAAAGAAATLIPGAPERRTTARPRTRASRAPPAAISRRSARPASRPGGPRVPDRDAARGDAAGAGRLQPRGHAGVPDAHQPAQRRRPLLGRLAPDHRHHAEPGHPGLREQRQAQRVRPRLRRPGAGDGARRRRALDAATRGGRAARLRRADRDQGHLRHRAARAHARLPADEGQRRHRGHDRRRAGARGAACRSSATPTPARGRRDDTCPQTANPWKRSQVRRRLVRRLGGGRRLAARGADRRLGHRQLASATRPATRASARSSRPTA